MGDRGNVQVLDGGERIWLYTHWRGSELPEIVQAALKRGKDRWDDAPYLTRIIFCEMLGESDPEETNGFGISPYMDDNENPVITVDIDKQLVYIGDKECWTFDKFIETKLGDTSHA